MRGKTLPNSNPLLFYTSSLQSSLSDSAFVTSLLSRAPETNGKALEINFGTKNRNSNHQFQQEITQITGLFELDNFSQ